VAEGPQIQKPAPAAGWWSLARLAAKSLVIAALIHFAFAPAAALDVAAGWSLYNRVFPGRLRLPYGDDPARAYNISVTNVKALFRSHVLDAPAPAPDDELRVILVGDSSVWGFRLGADETLAAHLNRLNLHSHGKRLAFYNLGYPTMSLLKDLVILDRALTYRPDLVVWLVTLESFPAGRQAESPLVSFNRAETASLLARSGLTTDRYLPQAPSATWWSGGLIHRRREFAELFRLQVYGLMWAASGVDHDTSASFAPRAEDLEADETFQGYAPGTLAAGDLAWEILEAGRATAAPVPVLFVNEPMFISRGANSDIRYNFFYPRWAYDDYRTWLADRCRGSGWLCAEVWDSLPGTDFTDSAVHYNAAGAERLASILAGPIQTAAAGLAPSP
jgi:hypothetical protein